MATHQARLSLTLLLLTFSLTTTKADFNLAYGATSFVAYNAANGVNVDKAAYKSCIEKTNDGSLTSTGALCIFDCVQYTFSAVFAVLSGGYGISIVENGIGGAQQTQAADPPKGDGSGKRRSTYEQALLDAFNRRMEAVQGETGYRAAAVGWRPRCIRTTPCVSPEHPWRSGKPSPSAYERLPRHGFFPRDGRDGQQRARASSEIPGHPRPLLHVLWARRTENRMA
ncbi:hypothetical protein Tdes44962_MAKER06567 [Teratosphaeria destructans]|uniref:Uncharacterized protein n=1 Tax=Teratosphaeria destructans TaxID=418781 RepID=A0A9W7T1K2_9PEZI|nr:hypothetical protein Tdes44962_MAKER06567 [Teratosphaeria destructans]